MNSRFSLIRRQPGQQGADSRGVKDRLRFPQAHASLGNAQFEPAAIFGGALPRYVSPSNQPLDVQRHR